MNTNTHTHTHTHTHTYLGRVRLGVTLHQINGRDERVGETARQHASQGTQAEVGGGVQLHFVGRHLD
jgi:hypothetical protein